MGSFKDCQKLSASLVRYAGTEAFMVWAFFVLSIAALLWLFSSGDFSFILTFSSLVSTSSFLMVLLTVESRRSVEGLSLRMAECYVAVFAGRLCAIIPHEGYLPFDRSGDWLYQASEVCALLAACALVYCCRVRHAGTYDAGADTMGHLWLMVPALAAACVLHPNLNGHLPSDVAWAFALYLESVAVLCQFSLFMKVGRAQPHTSHFLAAQALAKAMSFIFWSACLRQLSDSGHEYVKSLVGPGVVAMQIIQLLVMGDFIFNYIDCIANGIPVSQVLGCSDMV